MDRKVLLKVEKLREYGKKKNGHRKMQSMLSTVTVIYSKIPAVLSNRTFCDWWRVFSVLSHAAATSHTWQLTLTM